MAPSDASQWQLAPYLIQVRPPDPGEHPGDPLTIGAHNYARLHSQVADLPQDTPVNGLTAQVVRDLLKPHKPSQEQCIGAVIIDPVMRVTYTVTIGQEPGRAWLKTCYVEPHDDDPDPKVFRVPAQTLARAAVAAMARWTPHDDEPQTFSVFLPTPHDEPLTRPAPETLCQLAQSAAPHREIAQSYGVKVETVQEWMRLARRKRPDLDWPAPRRTGRRRPTTQTTGTDQAPATDTEPRK